MRTARDFIIARVQAEPAPTDRQRALLDELVRRRASEKALTAADEKARAGEDSRR